MEMAVQIFNSILQTFLIFGLGALAMKLGMLKKETLPALTRMAMDLFFPFLTFSTVTGLAGSQTSGKDLLLLPLLGAGMMAFGYAAGFLFKNLLFDRSRERTGTLHHICSINNYVFLPIIVINSLWGGERVGLLLVMNVGFTIAFWTFGILAFAGKITFKEILQKVFSINIIAVFAALVFLLGGIPVPKVLAGVSSMVGQLAVPLMLILTGAALYECFGSLRENLKDAFITVLIRLFILPVILLFILKSLPISRDLYEISAVIATMPAASASVLVAARYGGSKEFAGQAILLTTVLSIFTVPLLLRFFL